MSIYSETELRAHSSTPHRLHDIVNPSCLFKGSNVDIKGDTYVVE
jgi:hypothetical protein